MKELQDDNGNIIHHSMLVFVSYLKNMNDEVKDTCWIDGEIEIEMNGLDQMDIVIKGEFNLFVVIIESEWNHMISEATKK